MLRILTSVCALCAVLALSAAAARTEAAAPRLETALAEALRAPGIAPTRTAALAVDLQTGEVVFSSRAARALAPASVEKLAVAFAALRLLGADYRFSTDVLGVGELVGRAWRGDLYLVGGGDPTLALPDLEALARDLARSGVRRVTGAVVGDESHFDARRAAPGWKPSFVGFESRPLSALSVEGTQIRGANGSAVAAARALTAALSPTGRRSPRRER